MKPSEILKAAKAKIATPATWIKEMYARDVRGAAVMGYNPNAICFCSVGAIQSVSSLHDSQPAREFLRRTMERDISYFNDTHSHAEVMAAWDKAIALAEAKEAADAS